MSKKMQLHIPTPCHENWENMALVEKGRFCSSCQKKVVDFSSMSDREVAMYFKKPSTGSVCGRFMEDQLNRDVEIERKRIPWVKYFFQFAIPAFLASCDTRAQGKVNVVTESKIADVKVVEKILQGEIVSLDIKPLQIEDTPDSMIAPLKIKKITRKESSIILPGVGLPVEKNVKSSPLRMTIPESHVINQDQVLVAGALTVRVGRVLNCHTSRRSNPFSFIKKLFKDTALNSISIYPNPIQSNSTLHIGWNQKEYGEFILQLYNQSGQLVFAKEINVDEKAQVISVGIPSAKPGNYFVKIISKGSRKSYTEKLIIE
ncbi:MAG TPA: T9SS type A sorting domain-containing protein [Chitinophagaceae bacterium]|nr:T9SS type A sorting domain-containing protein [Chitinophagaceae bacterium]